MYKCSCGFETEKGNAYSAHFTHYKGDEQHKRLGWEDPATGTLYSTRPTPKEAAKAKAAAEPKAVGRKDGAIVFHLGPLDITMNPEDLYDTYRYYEDIKRMRPDIDDEFSLGCKGAMKYCWEKYSHQEAKRLEVALKQEG